MARQQIFVLILTALFANVATSQTDQSTDRSVSQLSREQIRSIKKTVQSAFQKTHDGYSSDEVILDDKLNEPFLEECANAHPDIAPTVFNWTLLNLRKAGQLKTKVTRRRRRTDSTKTEGLKFVAEIAARKIQDKHKVSTDRVMCVPSFRKEFDETVLGIDKDADLYLARKVAFQLRKTRRLKPELITRIADWDRKVIDKSVAECSKNLERIPKLPGIYIFRDKTGYLYVGEAIDLRKRLSTHLKESDRKSLANYLSEHADKNIRIEIHAFAADSRMKEIAVRRAYESELIRSRKPRFNVRN